MKQIIFWFLMVCLFVGCNRSTTEIVEQDEQSYAVEDETFESVIDCENGVFYFMETGIEFAYELSRFIEAHPHLEVVTYAGDGTGGKWSYGGSDVGYVVLCRNKN